MITAIPPSRVLHEWAAISAGLSNAWRRDPKRHWMDVIGQAIAGQLQFWRVTGDGDGFIATEITRAAGRRTLWVIYAGGRAMGLRAMRRLLETVEIIALRQSCDVVRFEGRDWRKVCPDYKAVQSDDGRWHFQKVMR